MSFVQVGNVFFLNQALADQFAQVQPEPRQVVVDLAAYSVEEGIPLPVVTHVIRPKAEQRAIYLPYADKLLVRGNAGAPLTPAEKALYLSLLKMTPEQRVSWAENKPSWHLWGCAIDLRNRHYKPAHRQQVFDWLKKRCFAPLWELLAHDVGRGDHVHLARRSFEWRKDWESKRGSWT